MTVSNPGGAVQAGIQFTHHLARNTDELIVFGHERLSERFTDQRVCSSLYPVDSPFYGLLWEQSVLPQLPDFQEIDVMFFPHSYCVLSDLNMPQVALIHDVSAVQGFANGPYTRFRKWMLPKVANYADQIITVSHYSKEQIQGTLGVPLENISVVYNGVNEFFRSSRTPDVSIEIPDEFILFVGSLSKRKNIRRLIKSFNQLGDSVDQKLVLVGPESKPSIDGEDISIAGRDVVSLGYVTTKELKYIYQKANLFVYPSLNEGFGLPPLEAMACGTPVVASSAAALPEVLDEGAHFVNPEEISSIREGIETVLTDHSYRSELIQKGYEVSERYTWERAGRELCGVLETVIGGSEQ